MGKNNSLLNFLPFQGKEAAKGFTLVELIVVIIILAILGTIAFISLQGYSASSRDSVRISDVNSMETALELFHLDAGKYPLPDNYEEIIYGTDILWYQGTVGETVVSQLSRSLNKIPTDPLNDKEYVFSVSGNKNEFQILNLLEGDLALNTISETNAANTTRTPSVDGQFNGLFVKTANYIFPTPSLITSEPISLGAGLLLDATNIKSQVITGGKNIPVVGSVISKTGELNIVLSVYNGTINKESIDAQKINAMKAIQGAYSGTELANVGIFKIILDKTTDEELISIADTVILDKTSSTAVVAPIVTPTNPTNLALSHTSGNKTFTFSWTGGSNNGGSCKLQYYKDGTTWTNISETTYDCDSTITNQLVTLPGDGWNSAWSSIQVRIIKTSDSAILGTFSQNLTCSSVAGSVSSTPNIDEDCNGEWNNISGVGDRVLEGTDNTYYYGGNLAGSGCGIDLSGCQAWANSQGYTYISFVNQPGYSPYCCYANNTGTKSYYDFNSAQQYTKSAGVYN